MCPFQHAWQKLEKVDNKVANLNSQVCHKVWQETMGVNDGTQ
jgi:hypothetical protein